jgi:broad specificity phosphatase PhoE
LVIWFKTYSFPLPNVVSDLEEIDTGDWTGRPGAEIFGPQGVVRSFEFDTITPNGESFNDVVERVRTFVEETLLDIHAKELASAQPRDVIHVAVFSHGMVMKAFYKYFTKFPHTTLLSYTISNTGEVRFVYRLVFTFLFLLSIFRKARGEMTWCMAKFNSTAHLQGAHL